MRYDPDLILTDSNRPDVVAYLQLRGYQAAQLAIMGNVALMNAYHDVGQSDSTELQTALAGAIMATLAAFPGGIPNEAILRHIAADELRRIIDQIPPRRIEIVTPERSTVIDSTVHYLTETILKIVALKHPVMLVGPAGCGKTTIGEHVAKALGLPFYITNTITDTHQLTGFVDGYGKYHSTPFRHAFEFGGVWIADEIDAWEAAALLAANSALANGYCMFPDNDNPIMRHPDFRMIATANTFGTGADRIYIGRNELDGASLDRFAVIEVDYDLTLERMFANGNDRWLEHVWSIRKQVNELKIRHVVSSRAITMGAAALDAGLPWEECEKIYLFKGMSERDRDKLE